MMLKLTDMRWRQTRKRRPYLQGRIAGFWITLTMSGELPEGQELSGTAGTLWIAQADSEPKQQEQGQG